ncbi:MAG: sensor histidine kinase, partial [Candidatus Abyssobacteria bacterium SURF_17]
WKDTEGGGRRSRYCRLWEFSVLITAGVSLTPLIVMTVFDYYSNRQAFKQETIRPLVRLALTTKRSLEFFLEERWAALDFIIHDKSFEELTDQEKLTLVFRNMRRSFGGFVDIGLIDSAGIQQTYVGPYALGGMNYKETDWFHEVVLRGVYVSDVFMGYRKFPHFVIAVKYEKDNGDFYILRTTIDTAILDQQIQSLAMRPGGDAFITNREGVLQTPSRFYGNVLETVPIAIPPFSENPEVQEIVDRRGNSYIMSYAYVNLSPFIVVLMKEPGTLMENWFTLRRNLVGFLILSIVVIVLLIMGTSSYLVSRIREADIRQAKTLHSIQYTSKMASIGRLAAGVAHEVNNPLAIINEKAGLAKDLIQLSEEFPQREKFLKLVESILRSVERCSTITHRLLGFAKRMDVQIETIDLEVLLKEVLSFLEKEAIYRNISVNIHADGGIPSIQSDRGQLQQAFLNIINNAVEELEGGGAIDIALRQENDDAVSVTITDNGRGISEENLKHIFEPFFTTKKEYGTGLGLSITYGIVEKLGGNISVKSAVGKGTSFTVTLPAHKSPV